jgi:hypothetical protein
MNEVDTMLVKQFLLRVRQEGYSLVENPPRSMSSEINIDIYRGKTKICTFDDQQLGPKWNLRVRTDDSTHDDIKNDYHKLFYMFINLRDLYIAYDAAEPLRGYDQSLGFRAIQQYDNWTLAVKGYSKTGELEFGTFLTGKKSYGNEKTILHNLYFNMACYHLAKMDFVIRSGLLPKEQLITSDNVKFFHISCCKTMEREGNLFDDDTKMALGEVTTDLEKVQDIFREIKYNTKPVSAKIPQYIETRILAAKGIFTKHQLDRESVPKGLYAYDVQFSRDEMKPELLWPKVIGHRFGTVITAKPLPIGEKGYTELGEKGFSLNPEKRLTLKDFQAKSKDYER